VAKPWQYRSPDARLRDLSYARQVEEERSARLDEQDNQRLLNLQTEMNVEVQRSADLDRRDDIGRQMEVEEQKSADLDRRYGREGVEDILRSGRSPREVLMGGAAEEEAAQRRETTHEVSRLRGARESLIQRETRELIDQLVEPYAQRADSEVALADLALGDLRRSLTLDQRQPTDIEARAQDILNAISEGAPASATAMPMSLLKPLFVPPEAFEALEEKVGEVPVVGPAIAKPVRREAEFLTSPLGATFLGRLPGLTTVSGLGGIAAAAPLEAAGAPEEVSLAAQVAGNVLVPGGGVVPMGAVTQPVRTGIRAARGLTEEAVSGARLAPEAGGPRVPQPGEALPVPLPEALDWKPVGARIADRFPESKKIYKNIKLARRAESGKRTRDYLATLDEQLNKGVDLEEAKRIAGQKYAGEMPDIEFAEPFITTPEELAALNRRGLEYARETGHVHEWERAYSAIVDMADKRVPRPHEIKAVRNIYGDELADAIELAAKDKDWWETALDLWMLPKAVRSSFDISWPARQGIMISGRHPLIWSKSIASNVRAYANPEWMIRQGKKLLDDPTPYGVRMNDGSVQELRFGDILEGMDIVAKEVEPYYRAQLAEKLWLIGGQVRRSRVAFTGAGNEARASMARHWLDVWTKAGVDISPERLEKLGGVLNALTGRSTAIPQGWLFDVLQATWWSPQYRLSGPQVVGTMVKHGPGALVKAATGGRLIPSADPYIAGIAAQNLVAFVGGGISILSMLKASGLAEVELDPRSSDFGKIKLGPMRFNFWGTSQLLVRTIAQSITTTRIDPELGPQTIDPGQPWARYWQSGASPEFSLITDYMKGETYLGRSLRPSEERGITAADIAKREAIERTLPLAWLDVKEAIEEDVLKGAFGGSLGMIGLGIQSYEPRAAQELQNIPEFRHMTVPQIQELKAFWDEVRDFRKRAEEEEGMVVPPELAIRVLGEATGRTPSFIDLAVDLRAGTSTRREARNPDYIRFIVENEEEVREDAPWLISQEIRLLIHEMQEVEAGAARQ